MPVTIEFPFDIGETVYVIDSDRVEVECDACDEGGYINSKASGKSAICPICHSTKVAYTNPIKRILKGEVTSLSFARQEDGEESLHYYVESEFKGTGYAVEYIYLTEESALEVLEKEAE